LQRVVELFWWTIRSVTSLFRFARMTKWVTGRPTEIASTFPSQGFGCRVIYVDLNSLFD
jgi:hypothetical protein